jgi:HCOMODA/2-hydroxy-3-carboxy-muconic semialdehyde decarboxylase
MSSTQPIPGDELAELVTANHVLSYLGVLDAFGHISVRDPHHTNRYWMSRAMAPGLVSAADLLAFDSDSDPLSAEAPPVYAERFIHGEIYRRCLDVISVVHCHAASVLPFGVVPSIPLRPISHMAGFLVTDVPVFEIRDHAGSSSDMLVRNRKLGAALADTLGEKPAVLMRGHGATIVGGSVRQAVFRAVYTVTNAMLQSQALRLGTPIYLTPEEAKNAGAANDKHIDRAWDLWARSANEHGRAWNVEVSKGPEEYTT